MRGVWSAAIRAGNSQTSRPRPRDPRGFGRSGVCRRSRGRRVPRRSRGRRPVDQGLGVGPDRVDPAEDEGLALIGRSAGLVSEFGPRSAPASQSSASERLISGISLAVVVVEASDTCGPPRRLVAPLSKAERHACLGQCAAGRHRRPWALLRGGAKLVETADDTLEELRWPVRGPRRLFPRMIFHVSHRKYVSYTID